MRNLIRWLLPVLLAANGMFMLLVPVRWYVAVPGVTEAGPLNVHFIRDIGAAYLAAAMGLGWWAAARRGALGAVLGAAVFLGVHMLVHIGEAAASPSGLNDVVRDFIGVYVPAVIAIWLVWTQAREGA